MGQHIAIDAMGGDHGAATVVAGAARALRRRPTVRFLFFGDQSQIEEALQDRRKLTSASDIVHTEVSVLADDKPRQALRKAKDSSMGLMLDSVRDGKVDGGMSAGNTGALMAMAKMKLGTMEGIDRPALTGLIPTLNSGNAVMLDMGANTECNSDNLVEFAIMGAAYARTALGVGIPRVALLNIGTEDLKGPEEIREAAARLRKVTDLPMEFVGYIEGNGLLRGNVDVIVHDGFSGNIALKTMEGTASFTIDILREAFRASLRAKLSYMISRSAVSHFRKVFNSNNYNGAVLLGLNGILLKSHGGADMYGIANAIQLCANMIENDITRQVERDMQNFK